MAASLGRALTCSVLISRTRELATLRELLDSVRRRGQGRVVLLSGDAGIGKSRLVAEAKADAAAQGFLLLQGRSEEHTSELQSHVNLVCRLLLEKKKTKEYAEH